MAVVVALLVGKAAVSFDFKVVNHDHADSLYLQMRKMFGSAALTRPTTLTLQIISDLTEAGTWMSELQHLPIHLAFTDLLQR